MLRLFKVKQIYAKSTTILFFLFVLFFFFNDTATTEIYTLSLHDALPISALRAFRRPFRRHIRPRSWSSRTGRSEEHTSELQSRRDLVCRLLLEKKKKIYRRYFIFCQI